MRLRTCERCFEAYYADENFKSPAFTKDPQGEVCDRCYDPTTSAKLEKKENGR